MTVHRPLHTGDATEDLVAGYRQIEKQYAGLVSCCAEFKIRLHAWHTNSYVNEVTRIVL